MRGGPAPRGSARDPSGARPDRPGARPGLAAAPLRIVQRPRWTAGPAAASDPGDDAQPGPGPRVAPHVDAGETGLRARLGQRVAVGHVHPQTVGPDPRRPAVRDLVDDHQTAAGPQDNHYKLLLDQRQKPYELRYLPEHVLL